MKILTVQDVEETILENLLDLHEELLSRKLDCDAEQAYSLLKAYRRFEDECFMLLYPYKEEGTENVD